MHMLHLATKVRKEPVVISIHDFTQALGMVQCEARAAILQRIASPAKVSICLEASFAVAFQLSYAIKGRTGWLIDNLLTRWPHHTWGIRNRHALVVMCTHSFGINWGVLSDWGVLSGLLEFPRLVGTIVSSEKAGNMCSSARVCSSFGLRSTG